MAEKADDDADQHLLTWVSSEHEIFGILREAHLVFFRLKLYDAMCPIMFCTSSS
jgi:hypothetical protein